MCERDSHSIGMMHVSVLMAFKLALLGELSWALEALEGSCSRVNSNVADYAADFAEEPSTTFVLAFVLSVISPTLCVKHLYLLVTTI